MVKRKEGGRARLGRETREGLGGKAPIYHSKDTAASENLIINELKQIVAM